MEYKNIFAICKSVYFGYVRGNKKFKDPQSMHIEAMRKIENDEFSWTSTSNPYELVHIVFDLRTEGDAAKSWLYTQKYIQNNLDNIHGPYDAMDKLKGKWVYIPVDRM